jgi:hypothetical protein
MIANETAFRMLALARVLSKLGPSLALHLAHEEIYANVLPAVCPLFVFRSGYCEFAFGRASIGSQDRAQGWVAGGTGARWFGHTSKNH